MKSFQTKKNSPFANLLDFLQPVCILTSQPEVYMIEEILKKKEQEFEKVGYLTFSNDELKNLDTGAYNVAI